MKLKILPDLLSFLKLPKILFKVNNEKTTFEDGQHITLATVKKSRSFARKGFDQLDSF